LKYITQTQEDIHVSQILVATYCSTSQKNYHPVLNLQHSRWSISWRVDSLDTDDKASEIQGIQAAYAVSMNKITL